jgi:uncharacterized protein
MLELSEDVISKLALDPVQIIQKISVDLNIPVSQVNATVNLIKEGNTIPFISRYRKEVTGSLDEIQVRDISHKLSYLENLEARRIEIIKGIFAQGKLSEELYQNISKCETLSELEDLYAPYKKKKKTRAMIAIEKGLEALADLMTQIKDIENEAARFVDIEKGVNSAEEALQGAMDIIAERIAQDMDNRKMIRDFVFSSGELVVKGLKEEAASVYKMYYDYREPLRLVKPHRILAINRGEKEEELSTKIEFDEEKSKEILTSRYKIANSFHKTAIEDGLSRLLIPSIVREIRSVNTETADQHGIQVFSENLKGLLLQPPIKRTRVLGIDPGIRTGTKAAALDENGKYLGYFLFYQGNAAAAQKAIAEAVKKYKCELLAIGNGTGSHEVQIVVAEAIREHDLPVQYTVVSEDGASVYSASELAGEEFPELDLTIRGAISIGRRLQDPLAEFVKIDPKSIGVGLYQHDVNQKALSEALDETVESVVNNVGVNINTASYALLRYVSGISISLAKNIVEYRDNSGAIHSREEFGKIAGFGPKTFVQAAGFLKVPESKDGLDNTWVHPENYKAARSILEIMKNGKEISQSQKEAIMAEYNTGEATIRDIIEELKKPNRDVREDYPAPILQKDVVKFEDLKPGMKVKGKVKNVVDFGAFVDIGIKETALIHVSELSDTFVKNPMDFLKVGDVKDFKIMEMDTVRKRISLSLKTNPGVSSGIKTSKPGEESRKQPRQNNFTPKPPAAGTLGSFLKQPLEFK